MCRNGIIDGVFETTIHLIAECEAYDNARGRAIEQYIDIMGRDWFDEVVLADDRGLSNFLGLVLGTPLEVVNVTKSLLSNIWMEVKNLREHTDLGITIWGWTSDSPVWIPTGVKTGLSNAQDRK